MSEKIDHFLDSSAQSGEVVSEGQFTLAGHKALRKLAQFSVPKPEQWVLKWVQGAVASRAQRIEFLQTRSYTEARAWLPEVPTRLAFHECLFQLKQIDSLFWNETTVGLRALLTRGKVTIRWPEKVWHWDGEKEAECTDDFLLQGASIGIRFELSNKLMRVSWQSGESYELFAKCRCCKVPIKLDSVRINGGYAKPRSMHVSSYHCSGSPNLMTAGWVEWEGSPDSEPVLAEGKRRRDPLKSGEAFHFWNPRTAQCRQLGFRFMISYPPNFSAFLSDMAVDKKKSPIMLKERFRFGLSRYGVRCLEIKTREVFWLGGEWVAEADDLRTDISGLQLEWGDDCLKILLQSLSRLPKPLLRLSTDLDKHQTSSYRGNYRKLDAVKGFLGGAALGFLKLGPVGALGLGTVGAAFGVSCSASEWEMAVKNFASAAREAATRIPEMTSEDWVLQGSKSQRTEA